MIFWNPMDVARRVGFAFALAAIAASWMMWSRPVTYAGRPITLPVVQTDSRARPFVHKNHRITPLADFALTAVVLSRESYRFDRAAEISPVDLALGWGPMSDARVIQRLDISQGGRWAHYRWSGSPPIPPYVINRHFANIHVIPASRQVGDALRRVRQGQVISIRGILVDVRGSDGWRWVSSVSRDDTGNGACEVIFAEEIRVRDA